MVDQPDERLGWERLFGFAGHCLYQPSGRGGRRQNLTRAVIAHIKAFGESNGVDHLEPSLKAGQRLKAKPSKTVNPETATARRAAAKMDEGDVKGAIRQLCSTDTLASPSRTSYQAILAKHPPAPLDRRTPSPIIAEPLTVSADEVLGAIRSFPPGSAGGPDGLRPQHLKDMTDRQVGSTLIESLTCFINLVLSGKVPVWVRPFLFGAGLFAFNKKGGCVRPIAVGLALRRLAAKVACRSVSEQCAAFLKPCQLGVGVKGGAEALAHGARRFLDCMPSSHVFVKLDFKNAFNSVRRDIVREAVASNAPCLLGYFDSAYGESSNLTFGDFMVESAEGVQQGDPLGPLLFCLAINPLLQDIQSEFVSGFLDDIGIGGEVSGVVADVRRLERDAEARGLALNHSKCEVIGLNDTNRPVWVASGLHFIECS